MMENVILCMSAPRFRRLNSHTTNANGNVNGNAQQVDDSVIHGKNSENIHDSHGILMVRSERSGGDGLRSVA